jgi:hypothetical protein
LSNVARTCGTTKSHYQQSFLTERVFLWGLCVCLFVCLFTTCHSTAVLQIPGKGKAVIDIVFQPVSHGPSDALLHLIPVSGLGARSTVLTFALEGSTVAATRASS